MKNLHALLVSVLLVVACLTMCKIDEEQTLGNNVFIDSSLNAVAIEDSQFTLFSYASFKFNYKIRTDTLILFTSSAPCKENSLCQFEYTYDLNPDEKTITMTPLNEESQTYFLQSKIEFKEIKSFFKMSNFDSIAIWLTQIHSTRIDDLGKYVVYPDGSFTVTSINYPFKKSARLHQEFLPSISEKIMKELYWIDNEQFKLSNTVGAHPILIKLCKYRQVERYCFEGYDFPWVYKTLNVFITKYTTNL